MSLIEDGKGAGYKAQVDDENCLCVSAISHTGQHHANHCHGTAYTMDIDGVVVDGNDYCFLYLQNTDDDDVIITSAHLWVNSSHEDTIVEAWIGHTLTGVENHSAVVPTNSNAGSGQTASGVFYVNDGSGNLATLSGGAVAGRFKPETTTKKWEKSSGWIIPKNQTFSLFVTKDVKLYGYISFFVHNPQQHP